MLFDDYGLGKLGDKTGGLWKNHILIENSGFLIPELSVFRTDIIDAVLQHNDIAESSEEVEFCEELSSKLEGLVLTEEAEQLLFEISERYGAVPMAVRSDALGEAFGNGVYDSKFGINSKDFLKFSFAEVLRSYFTEAAFEFRKAANLPQQFGMQFMPIVGQEWMSLRDNNVFAPVFSGVCYTSTDNEGAYILFEAGISGAVNSRDALRFDESIAQGRVPSGCEDLFDYLDKGPKWAKMLPFKHACPARTFEYSKESGVDSVVRGALKSNAGLFFQEVSMPSVFDIFERINFLDERTEAPLYFEWAMTTSQTGYDSYFHILQIAEVPQKDESVSFVDNPDYEGDCLVGAGMQDVSKIVFYNEFSDPAKLYNLNKECDDYVLVYSNITTSKGYDDERRVDPLRGGSELDIVLCSKALGYVEVQDGRYIGRPEDHLLHRVDMTGKFFGILEPDGDVFGTDLRVVEGSYFAASSKKEKRFQIYSKL